MGGTSFGFVTLALGAQEATGTAVHYKIIERVFAVASGHHVTLDLKCPAGMVPTGGGAHYGAGAFQGYANALYSYISESDLDFSHKGWASTAVVTNKAGTTSFTADVVCAIL